MGSNMFKKILALFLIGTQVALATPTTVIDGGFVRGQANMSRNFFASPFAEKNATYLTGTNVTVTRVTSAGNQLNGIASYNLSSATAGGTALSPAITLQDDVIGNCEASVLVKGSSGSSANYTFYIDNGSGTVLNSVVLPAVTVWTKVVLNYPCASGYKVGFSHQLTGTDVIQAGNFYWGAATNLGSVSQAQFIGSAYLAKSACSVSVTSTSLASFGTNAGCPGPTIEFNPGPGVIQTTDVDAVKFTVNNLPGGYYKVRIGGDVNWGTATAIMSLAVNDGTTTSGSFTGGPNTTGGRMGFITEGTFYYSSTGNRTFELFGSADSGTLNLDNNNNLNARTWISIERFPSQSEIAARSADPQTPTIQKFTTGSGTYTTPAKVTYIKVRMVGGGGGGGGASGAGAGGGTGNATTFGSSLLTSNGGGGGVSNGGGASGAGGSCTLNTPAIGTAIQGAQGQGSAQGTGSGTAAMAGGMGASTPFGGGGAGGYGSGSAGITPVANTGAGGGGGGAGATTNTGGGGSAGCYIEAIVPAGSYSYSVGTGGTAGAGGFSGGAGGSGYIEVTEYYSTSAPLLIGSVTSNSAGMERVERAIVASAGTITKQSGSWLSVNKSGTGQYDLTFSPTFSDIPTCQCTLITDAGAATAGRCQVSSGTAQTASTTRLFTSVGGASADTSFGVSCMGPR